ncbi:MAG: ABC transporter permease, partial [Bacteroidia bacterium]|nr:ABC transporter permease [Bacteroidia bacterium]
MNIKNTYISYQNMLSKNRALKQCVRIFLMLVFIAILAPFIANDKPLVFKYKGQWLFPAFSFKHKVIINNETINYNMGREWKFLNSDICIFPICAYSPNTIDANNAPRKSPFAKQIMILKNEQIIPMPFKFRHWLGTTQNGTDVLSGIIHGSRVSLSIGVFSMLIASLLGILLGASAGYFENNQLKIGYVQLLFLVLGIFLTYFYCVIIRGDKLIASFNEGGIWLILRLLFLVYVSFKTIGGLIWIGGYIDKKLNTIAKLNFPMDSIVSKMIEVLNSIPILLLIIAISAITKPSYTLLILIIGFLSWTTIARLTRAEYLKAKQLDYVTACKAIGMSNYRIIIKHILPNALPVLLVQIIFGMAGAVLIEASLSFIGVGVPVNTVT